MLFIYNCTNGTEEMGQTVVTLEVAHPVIMIWL